LAGAANSIGHFRIGKFAVAESNCLQSAAVIVIFE